MKIAEALINRADLQKKISQIKIRLSNNSKIQEGEKPTEEPKTLIQELDICLVQLEELIVSINKANINNIVEDKKSIMDLIAAKEVLKLNISIKREFFNSASQLVQNYSKTEIKVYSTIDVVKVQKELDSLSQQLRKLEIKIQESNWKFDI
jgi:ferritin-like metal-binding protein YciE